MTPDQASHESRWSWWVAVTGLFMVALSFNATTSIAILLKPLTQEWSTGASSVALVHTSAMFGAAIGGVVLGRMLERIGFFRMALVAAASTALGLMLAATSQNLLTFHLAYGVLIGGVGQGVLFSPLTAAVSQWFDRHRGTAIAIVASGQSVGGLLLPPLMRTAVDSIGWRATLLAYGAAAGVALAACAFAFRRVPAPQIVSPQASCDGPRQRSLPGKTFVLLWACMTLTNNASFMVITHLTAFGEEQGFASASSAGLVSAMLGMTLFSRLSVGQLAMRWGRYQVLLAMSVLLAIGIACLSASHGPVAIGASITMIGLAFGGYLPGYAILVRESFPAVEAGRRIAEIYFFAFISAGIGSWTSGSLRDLSGAYTLPFETAALSACLGAVLLMGLRRSLRSA